MKKPFWKIVNEVIQKCDIILEVADARFPVESRNEELEKKVKRAGKKLIVVLNKCDLVSKDLLDKIKNKIPDSVFVSSKENLGTTILRKKILESTRGKDVVAGVVGYPNTGKSSLINMLKHSKATGTSSYAGFTKTKQFVRIDRKIVLIDTPGVLQYMERDESKLALLNAISPSNLKEPDMPAMEIIEKFANENPSALENFYGIELKGDACETLEEIALKMKKFRKKGEPDTDSASRKIVDDWQKGRISL